MSGPTGERPSGDSDSLVTDEALARRVPGNLDPAGTALFHCANETT